MKNEVKAGVALIVTIAAASILSFFISSGKWLKIMLIFLLGGVAGYAVNEMIGATEVEIRTPAPEPPPAYEDTTKIAYGGIDLSELNETKPDFGRDTVWTWACYVGWNWAQTVTLPERTGTVTLDQSGLPQYSADLFIEGYSFDIVTPMENTIVYVESQKRPSEGFMLNFARSSGIKLVPPRKGGRYAGMVKTEKVGVYKVTLRKAADETF